MKTTALVAILIACLTLVVGGLLVDAAPPRPASFYGTVRVNGASAPTYMSVEARISGVTYATVRIQTVGTDSVYTLDVPGNTELPGKQGGTPGETIEFYVGDVRCDQTAEWQEGIHTALNLTATGSVPTATPSETPMPSSTPTNTLTPSNTPLVTPTPAVLDLSAEKDTFISEWEPNTNYGTDHRVKVRSNAYRSLLYFDLSFISSDATVTAATLNLYLDWYEHQMQASPDVSVHKVLADWEEIQATWYHRQTKVTWGTAGCGSTSDRDPTARASAVVSEVSTWYSWDIAELAQEWVWLGSSNKGMLVVSNSGRELRFHSSEYTTNQPYLHIEYSTGGGPGPSRTATATPTLTPIVSSTPAYTEIRNASMDTYLDATYPTQNYENKGLRVAGQGYKRSLLDFDISEIPADSQIVSATLSLTSSTYDDGNSDRSILVGAYLVHRSWLPSQASWTAATSSDNWGALGGDAVPADREGTPSGETRLQEVSTGTIAWQTVVYEWDVASIVQAWLDDPGGTGGLMVLSQDPVFRDIGFYDSAYLGQDGDALHPLLQVYWRPRTGSPTPEVTPSTTPTSNYASVSGTIYADLNANGVREAGELGVLNVTVQLYSGEAMIAQRVTPGDGSYVIGSLDPGPYTLKIVLPDGYGTASRNPRVLNLLAGSARTEDCGIFEAEFTNLPLLYRNKSK